MKTKRWRGYYRAIKRKEPWALKLQALEKSNPLSFLFAVHYGPYIADFIPQANVFLKTMNKIEPGFYHQPIILGLEHGVTYKVDNTPKKKKPWRW
jgi:hypothetical protein